MVEHCSYVIVGGGIAGVTAAETLRNEEPSAEITVIADTPLPAYYRPALKDYLAGRVTEDTLYVRRRSFYADLGIHFMLDRAVVERPTSFFKLIFDDGRTVCGQLRASMRCMPWSMSSPPPERSGSARHSRS